MQRLSSACAVLLTLALAPEANVRALTLAEMAASADGAVYGEILATRVFRVDDPVDGPELYFTVLTLAGTSLAEDRPITLELCFRGGFVTPTEGVFNSTAPAAQDVRIGTRVVAFYRWSDDLGGGVRGNDLVAAHAGLYRTVEGPRGTTVLGRGAGFAVARNVRLAELTRAYQDRLALSPRR